MSRYNPGLEAGIIPGDLRAFKKDGQRIRLYGWYEALVEVATEVVSSDSFEEATQAAVESLSDGENLGNLYETVASNAPDFAQFEQYLGADALQTTAEAVGQTSTELANSLSIVDAASPIADALGEGVPGAATDFLNNAVDLQAQANDLIAAAEAGQYSIGDKLSSIASSLSTKVSDYIANELPKQATAFAKNQLVAAAKSVVASTLGNSPAGQAAAAALNRGIDKTANAVVASSTSYGVLGTTSSAFSVTDAPAATIPQGTAFDDNGNLNNGWTLREDGSPVFLGGGFVDSTGQYLSPPPAAVPNTGFGFTVDGILKSGFALVDGVVQDLRNLSVTDIAKLVDAKAAGLVNVVVGAANSLLATGATPIDAAIAGLTASGISAAAAALLAPITPSGNIAAAAVAALDKTAALTNLARQQATQAAQGLGNATTGDWRVRLSLAENAGYLYNAAAEGTILYPLSKTGGVIFPYTPSITTSYKADYEPYSLTHSNFKGYFYKSSYVDPINIKATFTAQDTAEANYLLAVIHFFRSVTKMFYGQDAYRGAPPPLVFLTGLGQYQFNNHPCVVASFDYSLPSDVNYIRSSSVFNVNGTNTLTARESTSTASNPLSYTIERLKNLGQGIDPGAQKAPAFVRILGQVSSQDPPSTYVPTKMDINISLYPMQSRQQVSQVFSLTEFANGNLLRKGFW